MIDWILNQHGVVLYLVLFLLLIGGAIGLPVPEDIPLVLAGVFVNHGKLDLKTTFLVCYLGIIIGDLIIFFAGRTFGLALFNQQWFRSRVTNRRIKKIRVNLERRSFMMIFLARHLFYMRTVTFLVCGAVRMRFQKFLIADALAALVSAPIMIALGYLFSEHYQDIFAAFGQAKFLVVILSVAAIGGFAFYKWKQSRATETDAE